MEFRTKYKAEKFDFPISYNSGMLFIGSCFSTHIFRRLKELKFNVLNNPFGTVYNPISIFESICCSIEDFENFYTERDGLFVNYKAHFDLRSTSKDDLESTLKQKCIETDQQIDNSSHIFITLGSSKIYERSHDREIVANCHKKPQNQFNERYLKVDEILDSYSHLHKFLKQKNGELKIILTISPVRYLGDGLAANQYNKSILRLACEEISKSYENSFYFPAYEIFIDDLRDYRFYEKDLIHPNDAGIQYVWELFKDSFLDEKTIATSKKVEKIINGINHKAFNPNSREHMRFIEKLISDMKNFPAELDFSKEINDLQSS